jgi:hypothetical protein
VAAAARMPNDRQVSDQLLLFRDVRPVYYTEPRVRLYHADCVETMAALPEASVDAIVTDPPYGLEFMGKEWDSIGSIGAVSHRGPTVEPSRFGRITFNGSSNVRCRKCDKWKWGHIIGDGGGGGLRCQCQQPDFPSPRPDQAKIMEAWHHAWAQQALRILKPGGHLLAFGGTRTHHRLMCALEDAGFEIRDCLMWLYGGGFPKSLDVSKAIDKAAGAEREPDDYSPNHKNAVAPRASSTPPKRTLTTGMGVSIPPSSRWTSASGW